MVETLKLAGDERGRIISLLQTRGPLVGNAIAKHLGSQSILISAFLSEMVAAKEVKASWLKVGGSPLYFLEGQESALENFVNFLPQKEKEVFFLLKKKLVLSDEAVEPAYRVALRNLKDFAVPLKVSGSGGEKFFWKLHSVGNEEISEKIKELILPEKPAEKPKLPAETETEKKKVTEEKKEKEKSKTIRTQKEKSKKMNEKIYSFLSELGATADAMQTSGKIILSSKAGDIEMLWIANMKKSISEADLALAYQEGQNARLPVLLLATGKLTKKAKVYATGLKGYLTIKEL